MSKQGDDESESKLPSLESEKNPKTREVGPFLRRLFEKQLFTDVTFYSHDNKADIAAHRAVLAAKCEYFKNLLFGEQQREVVGMVMQQKICDVRFSAFESIVRYFYTDDIEFSPDKTALEIYEAAQHFEIQDLADRCKIYIESMELTGSNVCSMLQACNDTRNEEFKGRFINYIQENTFPIINSGDYLICSLSTVREICELEPLNLRSEGELLEAVLRWVSHRPTNTRAGLTKSLLRSLRLLSFTPKEFSTVMQAHAGLLTPREALKILVYLNNPTPEDLKTLPEWCNKSRRSFLADQKEKAGRIKILLKLSDESQDVTEATCVLYLNCINGVHQIKSLKFSFQDAQGGESFHADLVIIVHVYDKKKKLTSFLINHPVNATESSFAFSRGVTVSSGQRVEIELSAKVNRSCKFFQFHKWKHDPSWNFNCWFESSPKRRKLIFVSEIEYEPLSPRLSSAQGKI